MWRCSTLPWLLPCSVLLPWEAAGADVEPGADWPGLGSFEGSWGACMLMIGLPS